MGSFNRFGFEWSKYPKIIPLYEKQFLGWVSPLRPEDFRGKRILDCGCGTGRNSWWPLQYGAAQVTAFDVDPRTVAVAAKNLANVSNATVLERSIYDIEFSNEFDIAFSIGVIHHLADPRRAVARLVEAVRPGGTVLIWVYGKEGYAWAKNFINVLRSRPSRRHGADLGLRKRRICLGEKFHQRPAQSHLAHASWSASLDDLSLFPAVLSLY